MDGGEHHHISVRPNDVDWDGGQRVNADGESPVIDVDQLLDPCWRKEEKEERGSGEV